MKKFTNLNFFQEISIKLVRDYQGKSRKIILISSGYVPYINKNILFKHSTKLRNLTVQHNI